MVEGNSSVVSTRSLTGGNTTRSEEIRNDTPLEDLGRMEPYQYPYLQRVGSRT